MKCSVLFLALMTILNFAATAGASEIYPAGPSNLLPADAVGNTVLWVGGDVAKNLFEKMTRAPSQSTGSAEIRFGEDVACYHEESNKEVEYSCVLTIETALGKAVAR